MAYGDMDQDSDMFAKIPVCYALNNHLIDLRYEARCHTLNSIEDASPQKNANFVKKRKKIQLFQISVVIII